MSADKGTGESDDGGADDGGRVLEYRVEPGARATARRLWWALLMFALALSAGAALLLNPFLELRESLGLGIYGTPAAPFLDTSGPRFMELAARPTGDERLDYLLHALLYLGLFLLMQWLFLMPRGSWRLTLNVEGRPLRRAAVAGGFVAMLLSAGLMAVLLDWRWTSIEGFAPAHGTDATIWAHLTYTEDGQRFGAVWLAMALLWVAWAAMLYRYNRSLDRHTFLTRVFRWLLAGTVLELLVAAPAYARTTGDDCYCARGSYTGLVFGLTAAFWLFGPGLFLLFVREKRRLERAIQG